jgi:putative hemolysin
LGVLFITSFIFSASETAMVSMSRHRLKVLRDEHPVLAPSIDKWLTDPNSMLTVLLIGINAVNMLAAIITENILDYIVHIMHWPKWIAPILSFGLVSIIVIEFCELVPKVIGYHNSEKVTLRVLRPMVFLARLAALPVRLMVWVSNSTIRAFGGKGGSSHGPFLTEAEILGMVDTGEEEGVLDKDEREMIHSIFEFRETQVKEVMTPRPYMHLAAADTTVTRMAQVIEEAKHSRIPIFDNNEDNIIGIINSRDLLKALKESRDNEHVRHFIQNAYFVPETKMIADLLQTFQSNRIHMAVVVDEYGATVGLVTLEDLLEEIVGEIWDEYDTEEPLYRWIDASTLRVDAHIDIAELNDLLESEFPDETDYETLAGLILDELGRLPRQGEETTIGKYSMTIEKMIGRRIATVLIKKLPPESQPETAEEK